MEKAPKKGKESSHSAHSNGMNESVKLCYKQINLHVFMEECSFVYDKEMFVWYTNECSIEGA
jgi:hypothetical protein